LIQGDQTLPISIGKASNRWLRRNIGKAIDPDGLKITTQEYLSSAGDVISEIDPNEI